jgi:hypothetical protein
LNLVDYIEPSAQKRQTMLLEKCPDKEASI